MTEPVFPAWTYQRAVTWRPEERAIPSPTTDASSYVRAFDRANNLVHIPFEQPPGAPE